MRRAAFVIVLAALAAAAYLAARPDGAAARGRDGGGAPAPAPVLPPLPAPSNPPPAPPPSSPDTVTITQITLFYRREGAPTRDATRSREDTLSLARDVIEKIQAGESMEALLAKHTDDRGGDGKPFNDGSYSISRGMKMNEAVKSAAFSTPVGRVAPEPIDTGLAFVVLRRDG